LKKITKQKERRKIMICTQCGYIHPPLDPGVKCPMVTTLISEGKSYKKELVGAESKINFNPMFEKIKNICISQIEKKKIKNTEALFSKITLEIIRIIENFKEDQ
jgi:hypothetical protein